MSWIQTNQNNLKQASEINMIPLIDVMLVLLIIFMLTAPLLTHSIPVNLPKTDVQAPPISENKPLEITIQADGSLYYGEQATTRDELQQQLIDYAQANSESSIHIRADEQVPYRFVAETMADVHHAGLTQIGLVSK